MKIGGNDRPAKSTPPNGIADRLAAWNVLKSIRKRMATFEAVIYHVEPNILALSFPSKFKRRHFFQQQNKNARPAPPNYCILMNLQVFCATGNYLLRIKWRWEHLVKHGNRVFLLYFFLSFRFFFFFISSFFWFFAKLGSFLVLFFFVLFPAEISERSG